MLTIRKFEKKDSEEVSALIIRTLREVNIRDYPQEYIERIVQKMQPDKMIIRAASTHFYVVCKEKRIVGCGAIGPYWNKEDESCLFSIFVHPDYHRQGIGRMIMGAIERDEYFLRAKRIEIPASITAVSFYLKFGYHYKNGKTKLDEEGLLRLEKVK